MILDLLFALRFVSLCLGWFIATRRKDWIGMFICVFYLCTTTVNYFYANPGLNTVFSTPLVFLTAWYIIKCSRR